MKKLFLFIGLLLLVILFSPASFAKVNFKDMPEDHWAARSVYNIVRLGVTRGYPDGTFRGEQTINRYELMVFLSNLAIAMEKMMDEKIAQAKFNTNSIDSSTTSNKILAELKAEIDTLRASVLANQQVQADRSMAANTYSAYGSGTSSTQKNWQVHGDYTFRANTFRVSGNADPLDYISQRAHLAVGYYAPLSGIIFDLDSGYVNPAVEGIAANITKNMLAVEAWAQTPGIWDSKFRVDATSGPGDFELNDFPSNWVVTRSGTIAYRPGNALKFTWELFNFDLSGRYEKRLNNVDRSTAKLGYNLSLEEVDLGNLYFAVGSEMYSQKGDESPTNSPRSIYEMKYKPIKWIALSARGSRLKTYTTEKIEYFSEVKFDCEIPQTYTEIQAKLVRLSSDFYVDDVSDEIIATNILGYAVLPEFESFGLGFKQHFFDRKIYIAGYNNISTTMVTDVDLINLFKENASHLEFGWNITPEASLIIFGRNTYCQLENNDEYEEIVDHLISGQFGISF